MQGGRGGNNILRNRVGDEKGGGWVPKPRECLQIVLLIRAQQTFE